MLVPLGQRQDPKPPPCQVPVARAKDAQAKPLQARIMPSPAGPWAPP